MVDECEGGFKDNKVILLMMIDITAWVIMELDQTRVRAQEGPSKTENDMKEFTKSNTIKKSRSEQ